MSPTSERHGCAVADQCVFDRRCEGFINCAEVDPRGLELQTEVLIGGAGKVYCGDARCDHAFKLPYGTIAIADIVEAAKVHEVEWHG